MKKVTNRAPTGSGSPHRHLENGASSRSSYAQDVLNNTEVSVLDRISLGCSPSQPLPMDQEASQCRSNRSNANSGALSSGGAVGARTPRDPSPAPNDAAPASNIGSQVLDLHDLLKDLGPAPEHTRPSTYSEYTTTTVMSQVPSLTYSAWSVPSSRYSASTSIASAVSGFPIADVNEPGSGPQHNGRQLCYECPFHFLRCTDFFMEKETWKAHALSHFLGRPPPAQVECPLCAPPPEPGHFLVEDDVDGAGVALPGSAWNKRMEHVSKHHELGWSLASAHPEFDLYEFLWKTDIINLAAYRSLKGRMRNSETMTTMMGGRRQDRPTIRLQRA